MKEARIFGLSGSEDIAQLIAKELDEPLEEIKEKCFEDGESYIRSSVNVRGRDIYVISSLFSDESQTTSDKLVKLMFFIRSLVDASAKKITAVIPYLSFARQDRKTESRAPINTKGLAIALESMGLNRLLTIDVHNLSGFQNAYRIQTDNLEAKKLLVNRIVGISQNGKKIDPLIDTTNKNIVIVCPDAGGAGRADAFAKELSSKLEYDIEVVYVNKIRTPDGLKGGKIIGEVENKTAIVVDDLIATGGTIRLAQKAVEAQGGEFWGVACTHGLFVGKANENLSEVKNILITDTVNPFRLSSTNKERLHIVDTSKIFASAIKRIHEGVGSISDLLG